jgi:D-3-phosphoglycerate dehydrogenase
MTVLAADPQLTPEQATERGAHALVDLPALLGRSDVVLLSCPLLDSTFHLIDAHALARMKPTAFLINIGRGALVDEGALIEALSQGRLAGAGLDVLGREPPDPANPLLAMRNVSPHSLGATVENATLWRPRCADRWRACCVVKSPTTPSIFDRYRLFHASNKTGGLGGHGQIFG